MIGETQRRFVGTAGQHVAKTIQAALVRLAESYDYASDSQCDVWDFAVEIGELTALGLSSEQLRWLIINGYARHGCEVTKRGDAARDFRPSYSLKFTNKTCFVPTDAGLCMTTNAPIERVIKRAA
jgi:hypothetical protein